MILILIFAEALALYGLIGEWDTTIVEGGVLRWYSLGAWFRPAARTEGGRVGKTTVAACQHRRWQPTPTLRAYHS